MAKSIGNADSAFNTSQETITNMAMENAEKWQLIVSWIESMLMPAKNKWADAWQAYQNPATRNTIITFAKNNTRKEYEPLLRMLVASLTGNPLVTDTDLHAMGITGRNKGGTPVPVPSSFPETEIRLPAPATIEIHFRDSGDTGRAKPYGVRGAEFRWAILNAPPVDWEDLLHSEFNTRSPFTLTFHGKQRGKIIYFALRWENTKGKKGPWCEIQSAIIP